MRAARKIGINMIYVGLLLFYTLKRHSTPRWVKTTIIGALGYLIAPFDIFSDFIPLIGYTDDLGVLVLAIIAISLYISKDVKQKAKAKLKDWFGVYGESELGYVYNKANKKIS